MRGASRAHGEDGRCLFWLESLRGLKMEAVFFSETFASAYESTRRHNPSTTSSSSPP
jgi:hypothetical protein